MPPAHQPFSHGERIRALIKFNGAAGCSADWLASKLGLSRGHVSVAIQAMNKNRHPDGLEVVNVGGNWGRYFLMTPEDAEVERIGEVGYFGVEAA